MFSLRGLRLYFPELEPWVAQSVSLPCHSSQFIYVRMWGRGVCYPPHSLFYTTLLGLALPVYLCANVGQQGLLVGALPAPSIRQSASLWVPWQQHESCPPRLPISTLPTCLDEYFFFISLVVQLP